MRIHRTLARPAAAVLESAFILPTTFFLIFGLCVGATGIFRYQEVASLARQGARYGSTHGYQYRKDSGETMGTSADWTADIYNNGIAPYIVALDTNQLSYQVSWPNVINQPSQLDNWPGSCVTVTVSYQWFPELYLMGPITLTSTSSMPITN